jgi:hypothetical protein
VPTIPSVVLPISIMAHRYSYCSAVGLLVGECDVACEWKALGSVFTCGGREEEAVSS